MFCLNPLKSGPTFGWNEEMQAGSHGFSLNPLKSGPTFGFIGIVPGNNGRTKSQSPQIGSYLRLKYSSLTE